MAYPVVGLVRPAVLVGALNGRLSSSLLVTAAPRSSTLLHVANRSWRALRAACQQAIGISLTYTGTYRSYAQQVSLFKSRYTNAPRENVHVHTDPRTGGVNVLTHRKRWRVENGGDGKWWYANPGVAMAAEPGTSNHGLGLAIDLAEPGDPLRPISQKALNWLVPNAIAYGYSWEAQSEPWHIRYVTGDLIPLATLAYEATDPPPPSEEPDMTPEQDKLLRDTLTAANAALAEAKKATAEATAAKTFTSQLMDVVIPGRSWSPSVWEWGKITAGKVDAVGVQIDALGSAAGGAAGEANAKLDAIAAEIAALEPGGEVVLGPVTVTLNGSVSGVLTSSPEPEPEPQPEPEG